MKVTMKRIEVQELLVALRGLDAKTEAVRNAEGKVTGSVQVPYQFGAETRMAFAKTIRAIKDEVDCQQETRDGMIRAARAKPSENGQAETRDMELAKQLNDFFRVPVEVEVFKAPVKDVNTEANQLPGSLLAALAPVLEE